MNEAAAAPEDATVGGWHAHLALHYRLDGQRTVSHDQHHGPLRVLKRLYPEGPAICHHVLLHPPGGVVGGDVLALQARLEAGSHALITTPGATRFYRSEAGPAAQRVRFEVAAGARLEWLPLETIAHSGCEAENSLQLALQPGAQAMGWDVLALGLPAAGEAFVAGRFRQHLEVQGVWLERGLIRAEDTALLNSPLGLAGKTVLATLWWASGSPLATAQREAFLNSARDLLDTSPLRAQAGVSAPQPGVVVLRALAHSVEPVMQLLQAVRGAWRQAAWGLAAEPPRVWLS